MAKIVVLAALFTVFSKPVDARMYQWLDAGSGNVQLSGSPPPWYRGQHQGPRVLVFDEGELVDDTARAVTESERTLLREEAFAGRGAETTPEFQAEARREELKEALAEAHESGIDIDAIAAEVVEEQAQQETAIDGAEDLGAKVATLKSLIDAWDQRQLDKARSILGLFPDQAVPGQ